MRLWRFSAWRKIDIIDEIIVEKRLASAAGDSHQPGGFVLRCPAGGLGGYWTCPKSVPALVCAGHHRIDPAFCKHSGGCLAGAAEQQTKSQRNFLGDQSGLSPQ